MALTVGENTYITLSKADTYFSNRLHTATWDNAINDEKEKALKWATSLMENRVVWKGRKADSTQTLQWPRSGLLDYYGNEVPSDTIPQSVKAVQCELANYLLETNPLTVPGGIKSMDLDGISLDMTDAGQTIPPKLFKPVEIFGSLIDSKATVKVSR